MVLLNLNVPAGWGTVHMTYYTYLHYLVAVYVLLQCCVNSDRMTLAQLVSTCKLQAIFVMQRKLNAQTWPCPTAAI